MTTRIPEDVLSELEEETSAVRSEVLRRLVRQGLADWRTERVLEQLREHRIPLREAAEYADASHVEIVSLAEEGTDVGCTTEDLERDLERT